MTLNVRHAAIHEQLDAIHEARVLRCKEHGGAANFTSIANAAGRNLSALLLGQANASA